DIFLRGPQAIDGGGFCLSMLFPGLRLEIFQAGFRFLDLGVDFVLIRFQCCLRVALVTHVRPFINFCVSRMPTRAIARVARKVPPDAIADERGISRSRTRTHRPNNGDDATSAMSEAQPLSGDLCLGAVGALGREIRTRRSASSSRSVRL